MPNRDLAFENRRLIARVNVKYAMVLDVGPCADADMVDVTTKYRAEPDTCFFTYLDIPDDDRIVRDERSFVDLWMIFSEWFDHESKQLEGYDSSVEKSPPVS